MTPRLWLNPVALLAMWTICALAQVSEPDAAARLRERYSALSGQLQQSSIQPGLYLESAENSRSARGDVYAVVDYPFATVRDAFANPESWCEAMLLHLNVKYCRAVVRDERATLSVAVGKKIEQPLSEAHRIEFVYEANVGTQDYAQITLDARRGPLGTRNYHMVLELIALEGERSFLHVQYSYNYGALARIAMRAYFASSGYNKVGFTKVSDKPGGPPHLIAGVRGALERNTMRYYLAFDAYLGTLGTPAPERFEASLERWFAATEHHALQLHEVDHDAYIAMKRNEYQRQEALP